MAKVRTFSRYYPGYHRRKGEETFFVEKMINWYWDTQNPKYFNIMEMVAELNGNKFNEDEIRQFNNSLNPEISDWKSHTIRVGAHFNKGDKLKPAVWTGKPYNSKQLQFLPEMEIVNTWDYKQDSDFYMNGELWAYSSSPSEWIAEIASNDGLDLHDFLSWFKYPKPSGEMQIICWNDKINYK